MRLLSWVALMVCFITFGSAESVTLPKENAKIVLITGCSRGIGLATAEHLAKNGYNVYATLRNSNEQPSTSNKSIHFKILDVTDAATIQKTVSEIIEKEGRIDVLINNAGYALGGPLESLSMKEVLEQMDTNFFGYIRMCQEVLPQMRKQKSGHIINISSEQGVYGWPFGSLYTASKAAIESMSEALSIEIMPFKINLSIIEPGFVATDFTVKLGSRKVEGNPYKKIDEMLVASLDEKREPCDDCQSAEDIAKFLQKVIEDPQPRLRYQTSPGVEKVVAEYITDPTGKEYTKRMKAETLDLFRDAWEKM